MADSYQIRLLDIIQTLYTTYLPQQLKTILLQKIHWFESRVITRLTHLSLPIYRLKGREKTEHAKITVLFLGEKTALTYISNLIYDEEPEQQFIGQIPIWSIRKQLNQLTKDVDLIFIKTDRFFSRFLQRKGFLITPEWVEMKMTISKPLENMFENLSSSAKKDIRTIEKQQYSYEISHDPQKFDFFYHQIFKPYTSQRHGKLTLLKYVHYTIVKQSFDKGNLLLVKDRDKYVAGSIIILRKNTAYPVFMGVLDDPPYLSKGAGAALYYFPVIWSKEHNMTLVNFGNSRPFLNDGGFQYKRKWGMTTEISKIFFGILGLKINNIAGKGVQDFLQHNPFISLEKNQLQGMIFASESATIEDIERLWKDYFTPGLSRLVLHSKTGFEKKLKESIASTFNGKIILIDTRRNY
jgi:hypothetical protein